MPGKSLDKYYDVLFRDFDETKHLTEAERIRLKRYRSAFTLSLENPSIPDTELCNFLIQEFGISRSQAYVDLGNIRVLLGNIKNAGKEWVRYLVNEELKSVIEEARDLGKKGLDKRINAAAVLARYNRLDKEDQPELPWEELVPQPIEPTSDPTVLKIKPLSNKEETIRKLYDKYKGDIEIEYTDYEEVKDDN